jgi:hypothetical protein
MTVCETLADLIRRPWQIAAHWNWKSAVVSSVLRGLIFFTTNLPAGLPAACRALAVDVAFRVPLVGVYAAIIQAFRRATPAWAATTIVAIGVPLVSHAIELGVHWSAGTARLEASVAASVGFSIVSSAFNLYAMRRGVLIVGEDDSSSLRSDLRRLPRLIGGFVMAPFAARRRP